MSWLNCQIKNFTSNKSPLPQKRGKMKVFHCKKCEKPSKNIPFRFKKLLPYQRKNFGKRAAVKDGRSHWHTFTIHMKSVGIFSVRFRFFFFFPQILKLFSWPLQRQKKLLYVYSPGTFVCEELCPNSFWKFCGHIGFLEESFSFLWMCVWSLSIIDCLNGWRGFWEPMRLMFPNMRFRETLHREMNKNHVAHSYTRFVSNFH